MKHKKSVWTGWFYSYIAGFDINAVNRLLGSGETKKMEQKKYIKTQIYCKCGEELQPQFDRGISCCGIGKPPMDIFDNGLYCPNCGLSVWGQAARDLSRSALDELMRAS